MLSELRVHRRVETVFLKLSSQKVQGWMILIAREIALPAKQLNSYRLTPLLYGLATGDPLWLVTRLVRVNYHKA